MFFLLIFLFFQGCLTASEAKQNLTGQLFLNSPVEDMTPFKYKLIKWSRIAPLLPVASAFYFRYFQKVKTEKILKNKFFLSGFGICTVGGLIGMKKTYDLDQYVLYSWPLIFHIYKSLNKKTKLSELELSRKKVIEGVIESELIRDFLIFLLAGNDIEKNYVQYLKKKLKEEFEEKLKEEFEEKLKEKFEEKLKEPFKKAKDFFSKKKSKFKIDELINNLEQPAEHDDKSEEEIT